MVLVAAPAQRIPKSARTHSIRVEARIAHDLLVPNADRAKPRGDRPNTRLRLRPAQAPPAGLDRMAERLRVGRPSDAIEEQLGDVARSGIV